jgi:hypothetical protein
MKCYTHIFGCEERDRVDWIGTAMDPSFCAMLPESTKQKAVTLQFSTHSMQKCKKPESTCGNAMDPVYIELLIME